MELPTAINPKSERDIISRKVARTGRQVNQATHMTVNYIIVANIIAIINPVNKKVESRRLPTRGIQTRQLINGESMRNVPPKLSIQDMNLHKLVYPAESDLEMEPFPNSLKISWAVLSPQPQWSTVSLNTSLKQRISVRQQHKRGIGQIGSLSLSLFEPHITLSLSGFHFLNTNSLLPASFSIYICWAITVIFEQGT